LDELSQDIAEGFWMSYSLQGMPGAPRSAEVNAALGRHGETGDLKGKKVCLFSELEGLSLHAIVLRNLFRNNELAAANFDLHFLGGLCRKKTIFSKRRGPGPKSSR